MPIRIGLDQELHRMREMLFQMEELVNTAMRRAMESLKQRDAVLAQQVIVDDDAINLLRYEIEQFCVDTIATQQPVATDLRTIMAIVHIAVEMERMGDHAAGVAKITLKVCNEPLLKPLIDLPRMVDIATEMLHEGIRAFLNGDVEKARAIIDRDDMVDGLHEQIYRELLTYMVEDPSTIRRATHLIWASHAVERFADRATNVAERTLFVATGRLEDLTSEASKAGYRPLDDN
ncbi:MAG: phosphate signaling complex protein PhoU [Anaerolineae bacterium]|jgi:phosphate transport system protein|nr:phosphate signaling complex protein PhoU [Anaerolineae bacterium]